MYDSVIKLVSESKTVNDYGDVEIVESNRTVFCEVKSIGMSEFYQAEATGLKPEIKFVLPDFLEYQNEKVVIYKGFNETEELKYTVLRTYQSGNLLEIICKRGID